MRFKPFHQSLSPVVFSILGIAVFWFIRVTYWSSVHETPFSDMADFEGIAHGILRDFDFSYSQYWRSYKSPTLPVLGAFIFGIFGEGNYFAWRIFQSLTICIGTVWLALEISRYSGSRWLGAIFIWTVALTKSSVFWSYKYATEGAAEALLYLIAANFLWALRRKSLPAFITTGALLTASILNRPNYVVILGFIPLYLFLARRFIIWGTVENLRFKQRAIFIACFLLGVALVWSPWIIRGYRLYGTILLTNTSGGHSLIFDLGHLKVTEPDGSITLKTNNELLAEAPSRFANDYQSHLHAQKLFREWVSEDPARYLRVFMARFYDTSSKHNVFLTTLSRTDLFPGWMNNVLIDKSNFMLIAGLLGLIALVTYSSAFWILPFAAVAPWIFAIIVANTSRYLDPMLPLYFFGLPASLFVLIPFIRSHTSTSRSVVLKPELTT